MSRSAVSEKFAQFLKSYSSSRTLPSGRVRQTERKEGERQRVRLHPWHTFHIIVIIMLHGFYGSASEVYPCRSAPQNIMAPAHTHTLKGTLAHALNESKWSWNNKLRETTTASVYASHLQLGLAGFRRSGSLRWKPKRLWVHRWVGVGVGVPVAEAGVLCGI